jgi:hypothetical protein
MPTLRIPALTDRRFPPPWSVGEQPAAFVVRDHNGQAPAYVYFEDEPGRRSTAKMLTKDEARRIAANFAKPPVLTHLSPPLDELGRWPSTAGTTCVTMI